MASLEQTAETPTGRASTSNKDMAPNNDIDMTALEDTESQNRHRKKEVRPRKTSAFKSLGWLDRFLAVWILLAMIVGVLLGNFVPQTGPALQKGKFVGVSVPIGMFWHSPKTTF